MSDLSDECDPVVYISDLKKLKTNIVIKSNLKDTDVAHPCGLIAASLFTDTYKLFDPNENEIAITSEGIAWPSDKGKKYKNKDLTTQWWDVEDERFMVWMRTAALPNFRKLWGIIKQDLQPGEYKIKIDNCYDVNEFDGKKYFVLSTANAFGGRNSFLGISYLVMGIICFLILVFFLYKKLTLSKEK